MLPFNFNKEKRVSRNFSDGLKDLFNYVLFLHCDVISYLSIAVE